MENTGKQSRSVGVFKAKRLLEDLASKEGRHTELITLYIPPGRQVSDVIANLREEYGTASNIKSRTTRHNVQSAIEKAIQRLKLIDQVPPTGLALFCGAVAQGPPGSEKMELYVLVPPEPIGVYLYRCDSRFHLEPLFDILKEKATYGIMVIDGSGATYAILRGKRLEIVKSISSGIAGKHRAGGQSARRFERLREVEINEYFKRAASYAAQIFSDIPDLKGIIIGGPGPTKQDFVEGRYLHYTLQDKVLAVVDTAYVDEQGVKEVMAKAPEILKNVRYVQERELVQQFLGELGRDSGLAVYGVEEVRKHLEAGSVRVLLLSEELDLLAVTVKCSACGFSEQRTVKEGELLSLEAETSKKPCPRCGVAALQLGEKTDLIDALTELAEKSNGEVEMISTSHEEGEMLLKSFGGVAALLRYKA
jgi:peptide chain release factor subunit 1